MKKLALLFLLLPVLTMAGEFRGAWVASVHNINFPSGSGQSVESQKAQIVRLLDTAKRCRLNALMVQVRPEGDALYASRLEPWSRFLTGSQGRNPGYDPLAFFISEGKKRGIDIHAWLNPFRASASFSNSRASNHISKRFPQYTYKIGSVLIMDPGSPEVQDHVVNVVRDILSRYDVAGIHFDDYFYPYPSDGGHVYSFPDEATYARYGKGMSKGDWRRENVNTLIRKVSSVVHSVRPGAKFGVSPFGIFQPGLPVGTTAGVDMYNQLYADALKWMRSGWIDYLAPQLYWRDKGPQSFSLLLKWWRSPQVNPRGVPVFPGIAIERLSEHGWAIDEITRQLQIEKNTSPRGQGGFILWNIQQLKNGTKGVDAVVAENR
jgi:uncharacterized lipoprotein YddW (UPF0748 family)